MLVSAACDVLENIELIKKLKARWKQVRACDLEEPGGKYGIASLPMPVIDFTLARWDNRDDLRLTIMSAGNAGDERSISIMR